METAREFAYFGDRLSAGERCEVAVTARTRRFWWIVFRECSELVW